MDSSHILCNHHASFLQTLPHVQHTLAVAVYHCCNIPLLYFEAHHKRYKETLNKLRQSIRTVRPNRNMTRVLLLHYNARPHNSLRTREAIAKMGLTVLSQPAHSPDLAPSDYHLFGPVKDALRTRHFADDSELKRSAPTSRQGI
jgi:hypothetical protein